MFLVAMSAYYILCFCYFYLLMYSLDICTISSLLSLSLSRAEKSEHYCLG